MPELTIFKQKLYTSLFFFSRINPLILDSSIIQSKAPYLLLLLFPARVLNSHFFQNKPLILVFLFQNKPPSPLTLRFNIMAVCKCGISMKEWNSWKKCLSSKFNAQIPIKDVRKGYRFPCYMTLLV